MGDHLILLVVMAKNQKRVTKVLANRINSRCQFIGIQRFVGSEFVNSAWIRIQRDEIVGTQLIPLWGVEANLTQADILPLKLNYTQW